MVIVQLFVAVLVLSVQLVTSSPPAEKIEYYTVGDRTCRMCPPGHHQKFRSCMECEACPAGSYSRVLNKDVSCHSCFRDCRPRNHLKVVQNCTPTSDLKCNCEVGYSCSNFVPHSENCRQCTKIQTTTEAPAVIAGKDEHTPAAITHSSALPPLCQFPKCASQLDARKGNDTDVKPDKTSNHLIAVLCSLVVIASISLVILTCVRCAGEKTCFKLALIKLRNEGSRDASSYKRKESTHQTTRDSAGAKQQTSSLSAANLGSVHVHNPGTVIFSLLSQFTGQVGPTREETRERVNYEEGEEEERSCPVFHPTPSPSAHLSEEERSAEMGQVFFPSQEQGKDCHMSKEEVQ
ncbi:uncharacterized protein LOC143003889 [Genypterus blacodes]|uniref:uncharacterized protein LOC143003889 n=1 Tax=Genypterus blacodes TaxID=154954 RepID=UPI003F75A30E